MRPGRSTLLLPLALLGAGCFPGREWSANYDDFILRSAALGEDRTVNIYLPQSYLDSDAVMVGVIYLPDGGVLGHFRHVAAVVDSLTRQGELLPTMVVGVEPVDRARDLTSPAPAGRSDGSAGTTPFHRFLLEELVPEIESRYRVSDRSVLVGDSLAGYFVVENFLRHPGTFDYNIAYLPELLLNDRELVHESGELLRRRGITPGTLHMWSIPDDVSLLTRAIEDSVRALDMPGIEAADIRMSALGNSNLYRIMWPITLYRLMHMDSTVRFP